MKTCRRCNIEKPLDGFYSNNHTGRDNTCKQCRTNKRHLRKAIAKPAEALDSKTIRLYSIVIIAKNSQFEVAANTFVKGKPKRYSRKFETRLQAQKHFEAVNQNNEVELNNEYLKTRGV